MYARIERFLARRTDVLIAVSDEVRDDLVGLGVAPARAFEVVRLGLDLSAFADDERSSRPPRCAPRRSGGWPRTAGGARSWRAWCRSSASTASCETAAMLRDRPDTRFVIVGDGELRDAAAGLRARARARGQGRLGGLPARRSGRLLRQRHRRPHLRQRGHARVSLIEAQAAGVPVVGTGVGGVRSVVLDGERRPAGRRARGDRRGDRARCWTTRRAPQRSPRAAGSQCSPRSASSAWWTRSRPLCPGKLFG